MDVSKSSQQNSSKERKALLLEIQELVSENAKLKQELEHKNEFLKNISIEARNHITCIKGFTELLIHDKQSKLTDKQNRYLANMISSVDRLYNLIIDIFKIS